MATIDAGTILAGRYRLVEPIAEGGMGMVFRGRDDGLDRDVAVKLVRRGPRGSLDDELAARFDREARVMAMVRHPNIVTIHDRGEHDNISFVVMEFLPGPDLGALQLRDGLFSVEDVLHHGAQVAAALDRLHAGDTPVVHRDLKPRNLILDRGGVLKVADFGIAVAPTSAMTRYTRLGYPIGTAAYMSPEQCRGEQVEPPSDIYSFGTVLYSLLTGGPPFTGSFEVCAVRIVTERPEPLPDRRPDVPAALAELIAGMLAKDAAARPTAAEVLRELRQIAAPPARPGDGEETGTDLLAAEFERVRAAAAAGRGAEAGMRWARLLAGARETLGPDHELTRAIVAFGELNRSAERLPPTQTPSPGSGKPSG